MQKLMIMILTLGLLAACTNEQAPTPPGGDIPSPSPTLVFTPTPNPSATLIPILPEVTKILPTPTPHLYTVEQNDTLTGIARKHDITLEELVAANPSVGSQALTVGFVLVIPPQQEAASEPTAPPLPVSIQQTKCYQNQDGSLWCLALLKNGYADAIQNLSINVSLLDSNGKVASIQTAYAPLDLLPSGKSIALGTLFMAPIPDGYSTQTQILSASSLPSTDKHYQLVHFQNYLVEVDWRAMSATVSGQVVLDKRSDSANRIWILAVVYDSSGNVIGFRRWESNDQLSTEDVLSFDFGVSSLGPEIDHIDLLVEAAN